MTKWVLHGIIFLIVAGIVAVTFINTDSSDDSSAILQLPALLLAGVYVGVIFVIYVLPAITDKATNAVLGSNVLIEKDSLQGARAAYARGDYGAAIEVYRGATEEEPGNRLPWVEIAKIQRDKLEDPGAAILTLREAQEKQEWPVEDAAFFLGRISDIYLDDLEDREAYIHVLNEIIELFPETRYSANARHKLKEIEEPNES